MLTEFELSPINADKQAAYNKEDDIAIIGIGCRLPASDDVDSLWEHLKSGNDLTCDMDELRRADIISYLKHTGQDYHRVEIERGAYLQDIDKFDYNFFGIAPKEAALMDPNQRIFFETAWKTIEDAGYGGGQLSGSNTGIYVGQCMNNEYQKMIADIEPDMLSLSVTGNLSSIIASRLSYQLDLKGPSMLINTACSSSLVALHTACQAIRNGDCDAAIVGSVQIYTLPIRKTVLGVESNEKRTRSFDDKADGVSGGEGSIAIFIKPLKKALQAKDTIYAIIKGSAVNQDGKCMAISAPNPVAQAEVIKKAWNNAGINPLHITYIEAHGTATSLGDVIEIEGLSKAFSEYTQQTQFCGIGSIKTNIGHLDAVAGLAGLLKVILALNKRVIPPSLHFQRPNRRIKFHKSPVYVNQRLQSWEASEGGRLAGVSSFGISGTNCHVILQEPQTLENVEDKGSVCFPQLLTISAKSESSLKKIIDAYQNISIEDLGIENICYTANVGRDHHSYRIAMIIYDGKDFYNKIKLVQTGFRSSDEVSDIYYTVSSSQGDEYIPDLSIWNCYHERVKELKKICEYYTNGRNINFSQLYSSGMVQRVRIPTYAFERSRCWIDFPQETHNSIYQIFTWEKEDKEYHDPKDIKAIIVIHDQSGCRHDCVVSALSKIENVFVYNPADFIIAIKKIPDLIKNNKIVYFSNYCIDKRSVMDFQGIIDGAVSNFLQIFNIMESVTSERIELLLVSQNADLIDGREKTVDLFGNMLFSFGRVINTEHYMVHCRALDIDEYTDYVKLLRWVLAEESEYLIGYRQQHRYICRLTFSQLEDCIKHKDSLADGDTVIVVGGLGEIGYEICRNLVQTCNINLIIIGKQKLPEPVYFSNIVSAGLNDKLIARIRKFESLRVFNPAIRYFCTDIEDYHDMEQTFCEIRETYQEINGVINCAGVGTGLKGERLNNLSNEVMRLILGPKVAGTWMLDHFIKDDRLKFFMTLSSPSSFTGGFGIGSYGAANAFLHTFGALRRIEGKPYMAVSLAPWVKTVNQSVPTYNKNNQVYQMLSTTDMIVHLCKLYNYSKHQLVLGHINYDIQWDIIKDLLPFRFHDEIKQFFDHKSLVIDEHNCITKSVQKVSFETVEERVLTVYKQMLGYSELSLTDNFYVLGGDSLIAVQIVKRLNDFLPDYEEIHLGQILRFPILSDFISSLVKNHIRDEEPVKSEERVIAQSQYYALSSPQTRCYLLSQKENISNTWHMRYLLRFFGCLDISKIEVAFQLLFARHAIFRTNFNLAHGNLVQEVKQQVEFSIRYYEHSVNPIDVIQAYDNTPYDLSKDTLLRVSIIKNDEHIYDMILHLSHIIADDISIEIIMSEIAALYNERPLEPAILQYTDYVQWQNDFLESDKGQQQKQFWLLYLKDVEKLSLPQDYCTDENDFSSDTLSFKIEKEQSEALLVLCSKLQIAPSWFFFAAYTISISKWCNQNELVIGMPVHGRGSAGSEELLGMFVNVLPIHARVDFSLTASDYLLYIKENMISILENQEYPYEKIVDSLFEQYEGDFSWLGDVCYNFHKYKQTTETFSDNIMVETIELQLDNSQQDLMFEIFQQKHAFTGRLVYHKSKYSKDSVQKFLNSLLEVAYEIIFDYSTILSKLRSADDVTRQEMETKFID